ncbi:unnamed protein product [Nippostrongylus brasiliensis]|uniref:Amino_oxidase domain-containing protein n=1 Tax=Nippostrongylus brasiliensis TaxID=27835 RepID=A0A0N4XCM9_NIPBR|nr:unnamed protein product [Nippostrongylus brasiliensis]
MVELVPAVALIEPEPLGEDFEQIKCIRDRLAHRGLFFSDRRDFDPNWDALENRAGPPTARILWAGEYEDGPDRGQREDRGREGHVVEDTYKAVIKIVADRKEQLKWDQKLERKVAHLRPPCPSSPSPPQAEE